jgi:transposase-like protein
MESKNKSLSLFEFQQRFATDNQCLAYLSAEKWKDGYRCPKCGHTHYCAGKALYSRQCTRCKHTDSPTAGTLFHKVKFSLLKAFYIVYFVSTNKNGISSTELSRKLELRQKTCWLFKRKVMAAMKSSGKYPLSGNVDVDEFFVGGQEEGKKGRGKENKQLVVLAIEKCNKGVSRFYGQVIKSATSKNLGNFMRTTIKAETNVKTDKWLGYRPLKNNFENLRQLSAGDKGGNFPEIHRTIMMFKAWLRGTHHRVKDLQAYIDEYSYRFNRHLNNATIFENLISRMIMAKPYYLYA